MGNVRHRKFPAHQIKYKSNVLKILASDVVNGGSLDRRDDNTSKLLRSRIIAKYPCLRVLTNDVKFGSNALLYCYASGAMYDTAARTQNLFRTFFARVYYQFFPIILGPQHT